MVDAIDFKQIGVLADAIVRKADILRLKAGTPPQDFHTKQHAGEIMTLAELITKEIGDVNYD